jgi:hypothetical protein
MADYGFDFELRGVEVYNFLKAAEIANAAYRQTDASLPEILAAYRDDASIRF